MSIRTIAVASALSILGGLPASANDLSHVPHEVLAFYYGWYGKKDWAPTARWQPRDGAYDSTDPAAIERQVSEAQKAGITGLIASWWPQRGTYTDAQLPLLLEAARRHGIKVSVIVEGYDAAKQKPSAETVYSDLDYVLTRYGGDPAWLTVAGRPVLFLYGRAVHDLPDAAAWDATLARLRAAHHGAIVLSDGQGNLRFNPQAKGSFDGLFSYGITSRSHGRTLAGIGRTLTELDRQYVADTAPGDIACVVVSPGYDDSQTTRARPRPVTERFDGRTYMATWNAALAARPDWILISTYNEWIEGTQIEPSREFGARALDQTAINSRVFLASPSRP